MDEQPTATTPTPASAPLFDPLLAFANWWVQSYGPIPRCPMAGITRVGKFSGLVLYRKAPYQVQLWICDPNSHIKQHSHPNVDQIHVFLSGGVDFFVNSIQEILSAALKAAPDGASTASGSSIRIRPGDLEEAFVGPEGWSFLTIQHWLSGEPKSVELDWVGEPLDEGHEIAIKQK